MTAGMLDHQCGYKLETTWNTPVVVDKFAEWLPGNGIDWDPDVAQGAGLRVGAQVDRTSRRVAQVGQASGKLGFELLSVGLGTIVKALMGTAASALADVGTTYQELYQLDSNGTYLPSLTIQEGIVTPGGTVHTYTYAGCSLTEGEFEVPEKGPATLTVTVDGRSLATNTSLAVASYPTGGSMFTSALPTSGGMKLGGTLTVPTGTALGSSSGATAVAIKSYKLSIKNGMDTDRRVVGSRNQPAVGRRMVSLTTVVEYDNTTGGTLRDAQISQSSQPILLTLETAEALSTGVATWQFAIPSAKIDKGAIPMPADGKVVTTSIDWSVLDDDTNAPLYIARRTADSALG